MFRKGKFNQNDLDKLRSMDYDEAKGLLNRLPVVLQARLFVDFCSNRQLLDVLKDWASTVCDPGRVGRSDLSDDEVSDLYRRKIVAALKRLRKVRKIHIVPVSFVERWS